MKVIIIAAGNGVRLRPLTDDTPKTLVSVAGKPILEHTLEALPQEITEIIIVIGYLGEKIKKYFGENYQGRPITYVVQEKLAGTAAALSLCEKLIAPQEKFLMLYGDDMYDSKDLETIVNSENLCLLVKEMTGTTRFGTLQLDDNGRLKNIIEKSTNPEPQAEDSNLIFASCALLNSEYFKYPPVKLPGKEEYGLPQTVVLMAKDYPIEIIKAHFWFPVGFPEDIVAAEEALKQ